MNKKNAVTDAVIILFISLCSFILFGYVDVLETLVHWSGKYENYEIDEIISTLIVTAVLLLIFSIRRVKELSALKYDLQQRNDELEGAIREIRQLEGLLPLCSFCKKIRLESGHWEQVDHYIINNTDAKISHGICPDCIREHYPEVYNKKKNDNNG